MKASEEKPWTIRGSLAGVSASDSNQGHDKNIARLNHCSVEKPHFRWTLMPALVV